MKSVLTINNLSVKFPGLYKTVFAVRNVSIDLREGEIVSLVGESGSGKTMTAMASLGLLPSSAVVTGQCNWLGETSELADLQKNPAAKGAIIFQNPLTALNPFFKIKQQLRDVAFARTNATKGNVDALILKSLSDVHLPEPDVAMEKYPHQLSGGQIQRIVIAMALICEPKVLIADEPTTALDVTVQAQILILLKELAASKGMAVLLITHDLGVVGTISDRVEVMYAGKIVESGTVREVLKTPSHPYTQQLLETVPKLDSYTDDALHFIPGQVPDLSKPILGCAFYGRCSKGTKDCLKSAPPIKTHLRQQFSCHEPWLEEKVALGEAQ